MLQLHLFAYNQAQAVTNVNFRAGSKDVPWKIQAKKITVDRDNKTIIARGRVRISRGNKTLSSDYAHYNWESKQMHLRKDFNAKMDSTLLHGEQAKINLETQKGWIKQGSASLQDPHLIFQGKKITKIGTRKYSFTNASITACKGKTPFWSIRSAQGKIPEKGHASLWHNKFLIKDYPVFYFPYLFLTSKVYIFF